MKTNPFGHVPHVIPHTYFLQREGVEEGPLTVAQVNRMKQRGLIAADTLCRADHDSSFRRLDEVLPHLKDYKGLDPEKMSKLKKDMDTFEIRSLTAGAFGSGLLCLAPLRAGAWASLVALVFGGALLFKYRKPIGIPAMLLGAAGLCLRIFVWGHAR